MYYKIKENNDLSRDINTRAIINTNRSALERAQDSKQKRISAEKRISTLEEKIDMILNILMEDKS